MITNSNKFCFTVWSSPDTELTPHTRNVPATIMCYTGLMVSFIG